MIKALRIVRSLFGVVAVWQLFGLIPVLGWWDQEVTGQMMAVVFVKSTVMIVSWASFVWLRSLINRLHRKQNATDRLLLPTQRTL